MGSVDRLRIYIKYNKHCAYCGKEIDIKDMQVDHLIPRRLGGSNEYENLMPSCRRCNHYKSGNTLETFRERISSIQERINKIYICKVAKDYGIVKFQEFDGVFYFEK